MTDDAKNLLRECLQYLYESAPAEVYDRITAHLAAPAPEPVAWILPGDDNEDVNGFIPARINREGEFTKPVYGPDLLAYADRMRAERDGWKTLSPCELMAGNAALMEYGKHWEGRAETAERQLAKLQQKTQHLVEPQNPCNCVPDGDDGKVAHLCSWHKEQFGKAYRMQNMADSLTIENIAKLPQDRLRLWIARGIQESTSRKRAEEQLAELQAKHDALVKWLDNNTTFTDSGNPVLASVSTQPSKRKYTKHSKYWGSNRMRAKLKRARAIRRRKARSKS